MILVSQDFPPVSGPCVVGHQTKTNGRDKSALGPIKYTPRWIGFPSGIYILASAAVHFMAQIWPALTPLAVFLEVHAAISALNPC